MALNKHNNNYYGLLHSYLVGIVITIILYVRTIKSINSKQLQLVTVNNIEYVQINNSFWGINSKPSWKPPTQFNRGCCCYSVIIINGKVVTDLINHVMHILRMPVCLGCLDKLIQWSPDSR